MANLPVPDTAQVEVRMVAFGQHIETVYQHKGDTAWGTLELQELAEAYVDAYQNNMDGTMGAAIVWSSVIARDLSGTGLQAEVVFDVGNATPANGTTLPLSTAFAVHKSTAGPGRSGSGRVFHPGITNLHLETGDGNRIEDGSIAAFVAAYNAVLGSVNAAAVNGSTQVIVSRQHAGVQLDPPVTYEVINYTARDVFVDSQRRRLTGRGT